MRLFQKIVAAALACMLLFTSLQLFALAQESAGMGTKIGEERGDKEQLEVAGESAMPPTTQPSPTPDSSLTTELEPGEGQQPTTQPVPSDEPQPTAQPVTSDEPQPTAEPPLSVIDPTQPLYENQNLEAGYALLLAEQVPLFVTADAVKAQQIMPSEQAFFAMLDAGVVYVTECEEMTAARIVFSALVIEEAAGTADGVKTGALLSVLKSGWVDTAFLRRLSGEEVVAYQDASQSFSSAEICYADEEQRFPLVPIGMRIAQGVADVSHTQVIETPLDIQDTENTAVPAALEYTASKIGISGVSSISKNGGVAQIRVSAIIPRNGTLDTLVWTSSDELVATVMATGSTEFAADAIVSARGNGSVKITASFASNPAIKMEKTMKISGQVVFPTAVELEKDQAVVEGKSLALKPVFSPKNTSKTKLKWGIESNAYGVTIGSTGVVSAKDMRLAQPVKVVVNAQSAEQQQISTETTLTIYPKPTKLRISEDVAKIIFLSYDQAGAALTNANPPAQQLEATLLPENALDDIQWKSSNTRVVTVDASGMIIARGNGTATITAYSKSYSKIKDTRTVQVDYPATDLRIRGKNNQSFALVGKTLQLYADVLPKNATNKKVTWSLETGAEGIATLSSSGLIRVEKTLPEGTSFPLPIVAKASAQGAEAGASVTATYQMNIYPAPATLTLSAPITMLDTSLKELSTTTLTAHISPKDASQAVMWKSANMKVATVDSDGVVTAVKNGTTTITANAVDGSGKFARETIRVGTIVQSVSLSGATKVAEGKSVQLTATLLPTNSSSKRLIWTSSDKNVATVSSSGKVSVKKNMAGKSFTITATATDGSAQFATRMMTISPLVEGIQITAIEADHMLEMGMTKNLTAQCVPSTASQAVLWASSNTRVASVDQNGLVSANQTGSATITATATDGSNRRASYAVLTTKGVTDITFSAERYSMMVGSRLMLSAKALPATATLKTITWSVSPEDEKKVSISTKGMLTVRPDVTNENFSVTAIATAKGGVAGEPFTKTVEVMIASIPESVRMNSVLPKDLYNERYVLLEMNSDATLAATVQPADALQNITWRSTDTSVATIDEKTGAVKGLKEGKVTFTATAVNGVKAELLVAVRNSRRYLAPIALEGNCTSQGTVGLSWKPKDEQNPPSQYGIYLKTAGVDQLLGTTALLHHEIKKQASGKQQYFVKTRVRQANGVYDEGGSAAPITVNVTNKSTYRALLVGQQNYAHSALVATDDNVMAMKAVLTHGATKYEVVSGMDWGKSSVLSRIQSTFAEASDNDVSLFFYAGHGASDPSDRLRGALCFADGSYMTGADLAAALKKVTGKVIVILESCFSGNMIWDGKSPTIASAEAQVAQQNPSSFNDEIIAAFRMQEQEISLQSGELRTPKFYVLTAAAQDQSGLEIYSTNGGGYGMLTFALCKSIGYERSMAASSSYRWGSTANGDGDGDGIVTLVEAHRYARTTISQLYAALRIDYDQQLVQIYPAGSTESLFFK